SLSQPEAKLPYPRLDKLYLELAIAVALYWRTSWYVPWRAALPFRCSSTSVPCASPGDVSSTFTANRTGGAPRGGPHNQVHIRARTRYTRSPFAVFITTALSFMGQSPASAQCRAPASADGVQASSYGSCCGSTAPATRRPTRHGWTRCPGLDRLVRGYGIVRRCAIIPGVYNYAPPHVPLAPDFLGSNAPACPWARSPTCGSHSAPPTPP